MHVFCITGTLPEDVARFVFQQLVVAVDFIHKKGKVNRDIKLANVRLRTTLACANAAVAAAESMHTVAQSESPTQQHACIHSMLGGCKQCSCTFLASHLHPMLPIVAACWHGQVLVVDSGTLPLVKMCDFGFSKDKFDDSAPQTQIGTALFTAPEVFLNVQVRAAWQ